MPRSAPDSLPASACPHGTPRRAHLPTLGPTLALALTCAGAIACSGSSGSSGGSTAGDTGSAGSTGSSVGGSGSGTAGTTSTGTTSNGAGDVGAGDMGPGTGGGGADGPVFYFVVHADPADPSVIQNPQSCADPNSNWGRLMSLMDTVAAHNAQRPPERQHRITLMFTPGWAYQMARGPCASQDQAMLAEWIGQGHEISLHSHTRGHAFRDGYSNEIAWLRDDVDTGDATHNCAEAPGPMAPDAQWLDRCSVDRGLADLMLALEGAGAPTQVPFAAIGPDTNVPSGNPQSESCVLQGQSLPADAACIDPEWVGDVAALIPNTADAYPVDHCDRDQAGALLGASRCSMWGEAPAPIYTLPIAPLRSESGDLRASLERVAEDLRAAAPGDLVSVVVHPKTYRSSGVMDRVFCDDPYRIQDPKAYIDALFDLLDGQAVTLQAPVIAPNSNPGPGCECTPATPMATVDIAALPDPITSVTLSQAKALDLQADDPGCG